MKIPDKDHFVGNSKSGTNYNHKLSWNALVIKQPKEVKKKSWNYYPRGRVEIRNGEALVFVNPFLNSEYFISIISDAFGLKDIPCRFISDGSEHYCCDTSVLE